MVDGKSLASFLIRVFFCAIPGLAISVIPYFFEPDVGKILFVVVFAFGWVITKPKPERGERTTYRTPQHRSRNHWRA